MTYCVGLSLHDGLVFASDSRTNAGVDYVTSYSKMHVFTPSPDRLFVILSRELVIVRQGQNAKFSDADFLRLILRP